MFVWWFLVGAMMGSAANAIIDRLPRGESWAKGRSRCDKCKHELGWIDLIPIISYLSLLGKCRYCHSPITSRNLWVEIVTGLLFVVINGNTLTLSGILLSGILWVTMMIAMIDWETNYVWEKMIAIWIILVVIWQIMFNFQSMITMNSIIGVLVGVGLIGGIWAFSKGKAMGFGDVEIVAVMGWWLGLSKLLSALWVAFVVGAIFGLWQLAKGNKKLSSEIAFGPFLILGTWVAWKYGDIMIRLVFTGKL